MPQAHCALKDGVNIERKHYFGGRKGVFWGEKGERGLDETQNLQVKSLSAREMVQVLRIAQAPVLSGRQSYNLLTWAWLRLTRGLVLAKRKRISSGQVSPADSGERR